MCYRPHFTVVTFQSVPSPDEEDGHAGDEDCGADEGGGGDGRDPLAGPASCPVAAAAALAAAAVPKERGGIEGVSEGGLQV